MYRSARVSLVALLLFGAFGQSLAGLEEADFSFKTTADLYDICSAEPSDPNHVSAQLACTAFIQATVQYHDAVSDRKKMKRLICYPEGATIATGREVFLAWAQANAGNAERMKEMPVVGLVRALAKRYPCK